MRDPIAKLARANEHVELFASKIGGVINPDSYHIIHELDNDAGKQSWRFDSPTPIIPIELSTIVGDALFNFRSALDQLVWQLVLANGCKPGRFNSFPIYISHEFKTKFKRSLEGVSPRAVGLIEHFQPQPGRNWELLFLPELNDIDKHRHLNLCVMSVQKAYINLSMKDPLEDTDVYLGSVENGTILCTTPIKKTKVEYHPTFEIQFGESNLRDTPVLMFLERVNSIIGDIFDQLKDEVK